MKNINKEKSSTFETQLIHEGLSPESSFFIGVSAYKIQIWGVTAAISRMPGHSSTKITKRYAKTLRDMIKDEMQKLK